MFLTVVNKRNSLVELLNAIDGHAHLAAAGGTEPELRHIPKIIEFLEYVPFECPNYPMEKL
ncbi:MAG: hypothetical protein M1353_07405, partial [Nitrospirae bacterium]|nr:hypothetical protein [Nitrospirota bacterium]